jgi:hypothetical protein
MLGDDDFLNPAAIRKCVELLDEKPDHVGAFGHYTQFRIKQNKSELQVRKLIQRSRCTYTQPSPFDRLFWAMMEIPITLYYAVKRTSVEIETLESVMEFDQGKCDYLISDPLLSSLTLLKGKMGNINMPYLCRETGQSVPREPVLAGEEMMIPSRGFSERYARARKIMLQHCPPDIDSHLAGQALDTAWGGFLGGFCLSPARMDSRFRKIKKAMENDSTGNKQQIPTQQNTPQSFNCTNLVRTRSSKGLSEIVDNLPVMDKKYIQEFAFALEYLHNYYELEHIRVLEDRGLYWLGGLKSYIETAKTTTSAPVPVYECCTLNFNRHAGLQRNSIP